MKRVKIMLTAVMVMAVVGGALAFKAKKFSNTCYYESSQQDKCTFIGTGTKTQGSAQSTGSYNTTKAKVGGVCPNQTGEVLCPNRYTTAAENS